MSHFDIATLIIGFVAYAGRRWLAILVVDGVATVLAPVLEAANLRRRRRRAGFLSSDM